MEQLKQFVQDSIDEWLQELSPEERLKGLSPEQLLAALSPKDRLALERLLMNEGSASASRPAKPEGDTK